jgi:hypothetical protein
MDDISEYGKIGGTLRRCLDDREFSIVKLYNGLCRP